MPQFCSGQPSACLMKPKAYYPLFANLTGRRCVVVGGGLIAQRKVTTLLRYGAQITLVSPTVTARLRVLAQRGTMAHIARRFRPTDVRGAWLVYGATDDEHINLLVARSAERQRIFTNIVDHTPLCSFIVPAMYRRGPLTIAVSTGGASPSLAKKIRDQIAATQGREVPSMLRLLAQLRGVAKRRLPVYRDRKRYFDQLVRGRVFQLVQQGQSRQAKAEALHLLDREAHRLRNGTKGKG